VTTEGETRATTAGIPESADGGAAPATELAAVVVVFDDRLWPLDPEQPATMTERTTAAAGTLRRRKRRGMELSSPAQI
jgi:hypothetical protein